MAVNYKVLLRELERELLHEDFAETEFESEFEAEAASAVSPQESRTLLSAQFAGDPELQAVADGRLRLGRPNDSPYPAPIQSTGPAVAKVQQSLMDLGYGLSTGVDGQYGQETYNAVYAYKQSFNIRTTGGYLDGIVGPLTITHIDSRFPPAPEVDCAGWESDPQSFSKRAAEHYLRAVWQPSFSVSSVACTAPPPNWNCNATVNTGAGLIVINVQLSPQDKLVRVTRLPDPTAHMVCFYGYRCLASGSLVFTGSSCPTF